MLINLLNNDPKPQGILGDVGRLKALAAQPLTANLVALTYFFWS